MPIQVGSRFSLGRPLLSRGPFGACARDAAPAPLPHDAGHALARGAHPERPQPHECLGRAVDIPHLGSDLGNKLDQFGVAHGMRARRPRFPRVVALARHLQRRAHLRHRPVGLVEEDELELALFAEAPTAACWRRGRSLLKVSRSRASACAGPRSSGTGCRRAPRRRRRPSSPSPTGCRGRSPARAPPRRTWCLISCTAPRPSA